MLRALHAQLSRRSVRGPDLAASAAGQSIASPSPATPRNDDLCPQFIGRKRGRIFLQIWHGGRACHPSLNGGAQPVATSPVAITGDQVQPPAGKKPYVLPRELLDEFLRDGANQRVGPYGGPLENRARLLFEVIAAVSEVWGSHRVGLRISPLNSYNSMIDSNPIALARWLAGRLNDFDLAYLHLLRADFFRQQKGDLVTPVRENYRGVLIGNMGYGADEAAQAVATGKLDAVAFGTSFLGNPDLPARIRRGAALNPANPATFYTRGAAGYTDYPALNA
ncbi:MAG: alkene reductase [Rhodobacteraceae bacterium]|nr:alkene reductase [Paracoccaceae bacterium]